MYTSHGHQIAGTPVTEPRPNKVARCGGPRICSVCGPEAMAAQEAMLSALDATDEDELEKLHNMFDQARAYAWEIGNGHPLVKNIKQASPDNPFMNPNWADNIPDEADPDYYEEGGMVAHARRELELIGEDEETTRMYLNVVRAFAAFGHSGGSASVAIPVINELLQQRALSPLSDDPDEWIRHSPDMWDGENHVWQNRRDGEAFSNDGGKTYYLLREGGRDDHREPLHESVPSKRTVDPEQDQPSQE